MLFTPFLQSFNRCTVSCLFVSALLCPALGASEVDLILHRARVVTVNPAFSIHQAVAVKEGHIFKVGTDNAVLADKGPNTKLENLSGKLVLPGLMDSHAHPADACLTEFDHAIPPMEHIQDVLDYIQARTRVVKEGGWIEVR